jgi:hypothetical protein
MAAEALVVSLRLKSALAVAIVYLHAECRYLSDGVTPLKRDAITVMVSSPQREKYKVIVGVLKYCSCTALVTGMATGLRVPAQGNEAGDECVL